MYDDSKHVAIVRCVGLLLLLANSNDKPRIYFFVFRGLGEDGEIQQKCVKSAYVVC